MTAQASGILEALRREPAASEIVDDIAAADYGSLGVLTLARPGQHNVLSLAAWRRIGKLTREWATHPQLRAVVIRGAGGRAFSAGADITEFQERRGSSREAASYSEVVAEALEAVSALRLPVIAMIGGLAVGGGLELAASCDVRIASQSARFGLPIGRLGVTLGLTEAAAIARCIGPAMLKYLVFSGELIEAPQALRIGLVEKVVPDQDLAADTARLIESISTAAPRTVQLAKAAADAVGRPVPLRDVEQLGREIIQAYDAADLAEGISAFLGHRPPCFPGNM